MESYDMSGKTIILFATSGGNGFGKSLENFDAGCKGANLLCGKLLNGADVETDIFKKAKNEPNVIEVKWKIWWEIKKVAN